MAQEKPALIGALFLPQETNGGKEKALGRLAHDQVDDDRNADQHQAAQE